MGSLDDYYKTVQAEFIEYIARMRAETQDYARKENANQYIIDKQNLKLEELHILKKKYDNLIQSILLVYNESFETGKAAGYKEAKKEADKENGLYNPYFPWEFENYREANKIKVRAKWPELF